MFFVYFNMCIDLVNFRLLYGTSHSLLYPSLDTDELGDAALVIPLIKVIYVESGLRGVEDSSPADKFAVNDSLDPELSSHSLKTSKAE